MADGEEDRVAVLSRISTVPTRTGGSGSPGEEGPDPAEHGGGCLLAKVLNVEQIDGDLYRGPTHWAPATKRTFGGQLMGQALLAASKYVPDNFDTHSLHSYFVQGADPKLPVIYQVERTKDGKSFAMCSVKAVQNGKPVLVLHASFHKPQTSPFQHQLTMPVVPPPEDLLNMDEHIDLYLNSPDLSEQSKKALQEMLTIDIPIEVKPVDPQPLTRYFACEPRYLFWVRAQGHIGEGNMKLHCSIAAYLSDYALLVTALLPYPSYRAPYTTSFIASLDHAMWFHSTFRSDEWMLYECDSPWAGDSRGLVQGRLWRRDGVLAVSVAQEGVLRVGRHAEANSKL